jgi:uncharacterized membrane protein
MDLEASKNLGGIGAILLLVGTLPVLSSYSFGVLALVGIVIILVALNSLANIYKERGIFNNSLYGLIVGIVGAVIAAVVIVVAVLSNLKTLLEQVYPSWNGQWSSLSSLSGMTPNTSNLTSSTVVSVFEGVLVAFVILWIFIIVWAFFVRRSLKTLADKSSVGLFSTAGLLLIIGAFLTIVIIGLLIMWIGVLLMVIAFFQMKPQPEQPMATMAPPPSTPTPV